MGQQKYNNRENRADQSSRVLQWAAARLRCRQVKTSAQYTRQAARRERERERERERWQREREREREERDKRVKDRERERVRERQREG